MMQMWETAIREKPLTVQRIREITYERYSFIVSKQSRQFIFLGPAFSRHAIDVRRHVLQHWASLQSSQIYPPHSLQLKTVIEQYLQLLSSHLWLSRRNNLDSPPTFHTQGIWLYSCDTNGSNHHIRRTLFCSLSTHIRDKCHTHKRKRMLRKLIYHMLHMGGFDRKLGLTHCNHSNSVEGSRCMFCFRSHWSAAVPHARDKCRCRCHIWDWKYIVSWDKLSKISIVPVHLTPEERQLHMLQLTSIGSNNRIQNWNDLIHW